MQLRKSINEFPVNENKLHFTLQQRLVFYNASESNHFYNES